VRPRREAGYLTLDKIAYRPDVPQVVSATQAAARCHNRALGLGEFKGRGILPTV
jgi:hypothetical protein